MYGITNPILLGLGCPGLGAMSFAPGFQWKNLGAFPGNLGQWCLVRCRGSSSVADEGAWSGRGVGPWNWAPSYNEGNNWLVATFWKCDKGDYDNTLWDHIIYRYGIMMYTVYIYTYMHIYIYSIYLDICRPLIWFKQLQLLTQWFRFTSLNMFNPKSGEDDEITSWAGIISTFSMSRAPGHG